MNSDEALCLDLFDKFCVANTFYSTHTQFHKLCKQAHVAPTRFAEFFPKLKAMLPSMDAQQFLAVYEKRVQNPIYQRGTICRDLKVLIIGAGPSGLRCAIECQLLGAKVVVIEKRDVFARNNVLHIWPFVIQDMKCLGAKRFYPKFCAGSINHIAISQLQNMLLKIALILGVEVHAGISFEKLVEPKPDTKSRWKIACELDDDSELDTISGIEAQEFDVVIGANGRQCNLPGFKRKALRAKLAIAITANFVNRHTAAEARVEEISGVSFIFKQSFFEELYDLTGIDLENIVYYKDETHYFIMTAKKSSLLMKSVLKQDFAETDDLLHPNNVNKTALKSYIMEAVNYSTQGKLPDLEFALNYRGEPDFSLFDFTSMYASENACKILERHGRKLVLALVGDSLLEPFWPMGTGCARGFLSALDAAWMIRSLAKGSSPLDVISERESIFKLLAQTTQENLNRNYSNYSVDPHSRYQNISIQNGKPYPVHIQELYDTGNGTGNPSQAQCNQVTNPAQVSGSLVGEGGPVSNQDQRSQSQLQVAKAKTKAKSPSPNEFRESKITSAVSNNGPPKTHTHNHNGKVMNTNVISQSPNKGSPQSESKRAEVDLESKSMSEKIDFLMEWIQSYVKPFRIDVRGVHDLFVRGDALCCLIHVFRPDLIPQFPFPPDVEEGIELVDAAGFRNQLAFDFLKAEYGIHCEESGLNSTLFTNVPVLVDFLTALYKVFRNKSPQTPASNPNQRKALWDPSRQHENRSGNLFQSVHRSATVANIDGRHKREHFRNNLPSFECPSTSSQRGAAHNDANAKQSNSNYTFEKSPDRLRKLAEAEETKNKAIQWINSLKEKRAEERKVKKEAAKKAIHSLQGGSKPAQAQAQAHFSAPAADAGSNANQSTLEGDDFFNEYNLRLWRKSVPTIQERSQKLENNLLESAGLTKKVVLNSCKQAGDRKTAQIGKINEQALSIMQQKFANTTGYTGKDKVHVQPQALASSSSKSQTDPNLKSNQKSASADSKSNNAGPRETESQCSNVGVKPTKSESATTAAHSSNPNKSNHMECDTLDKNKNKTDLDEEQLARALFHPTNKRDGQILANSKDSDVDLDELEAEIDDDTLSELSKEEIDNILNWSGKYL